MISSNTPSSLAVSSAYVAAIGPQLSVLSGFAQAGTAAELVRSWPDVEETLRLNDICAAEIGSLPDDDALLPAFKAKILDALCPSLDRGIAWLLQEPSAHTVTMLKGIDANDIPLFRECGVLTAPTADMLVASARLYMRFGEQLETVHQYLASTGLVSDELMRQLRLTFALNGIDTDLVKMATAANPATTYHLKSLVRQKITLVLETRLRTIQDNTANWAALKRDHGITEKILRDAAASGVISRAARERIVQAFGSEHTSTGRIAVRAGMVASLAAAAINYAAGGRMLITGGLVAAAVGVPLLAVMVRMAMRQRER